MIEILRDSRVVVRVDETKKPIVLGWVREESVPAGFRLLVDQETLEEMTGGRADNGDYYTQAFTVKKGTQAWLNRVLETLWVWGLNAKEKKTAQDDD